MKVVLLDYVKNLGDRNDLVEVKPGYANNYLIPNGLALAATKANLKDLQEMERQVAHRQAQQLEAAQTIKQQIEELSLKIEALVGQDDKIFGSVTALQLSNLLSDYGIAVDRRKLEMPEDIKTLGEYEAEAVLHKEVRATIKFEVVAKSDN